MPLSLVLRDLFEPKIVASLLDYAVSREADFRPAKLGVDRVIPAYRKSSVIHDLGPFKETFETRILGLAPMLAEKLRMLRVDNPKLQLELVAHNDGAFYKQHIDTLPGTDFAERKTRLISGVYYFHTMPKAFSGGALRIHSLGIEGSGKARIVDYEPHHNSFVAFPSFAPHEVMPVSCPSQRFEHSRFAMNCWISVKRDPPK